MKKEGKAVMLFKAYKNLYSMMSVKDKVNFVLITLITLTKCFTIILTAQILAAVVSKVEGTTGYILGFALPTSWSLIQVVIFCYAMILIASILSFLTLNILKKYSVHMSCKVNKIVLNELTKPRKNLDFKMSNGEAVFIAKSVGESVIYLIKDLWVKIFIPIMSCVLALIYIAQIDVVCFLIFLLCFTLIIISSFVRLQIQARLDNKIETSKSKINNLYLNSIVNLPLITMSKSQEHENNILEQENKIYKKNWYKLTDLALWYWIASYILEYFFVALGVIVCILRAGVNISSVVLLISYAGQLCSPLENVGVELGYLQQRAMQFLRLDLVKAGEQNIVSANSGKNLKVLSNVPNDVKIENIKMNNFKINIGDFSRIYPDIEFKNNQINVVVGFSGSGKSVLINCLLGLKNYESGEIVINDKFRVKSLYNNIENVSFAMQNAMIFDRSVIDNVMYPDHELNVDAEKYIKSLGLNELIKRDNSNSNVIATLSGGEQRRIALVRCVQKKVPIYIFDEPTNDLDNKNITKVLKLIEKLKKRSMVIVISHDKRVIEIADNLIEL